MRVSKTVPIGIVGGDVAPAGEGAPCHVASLVVTDAPDQLLHAGKNAAFHADLVPGVVAGQRQHAFDHVVIGDGRPDLGSR